MGRIGPTELLLVLLVATLLLGAKRLPDLARGSGRALRIFKTEIDDLGGGRRSTDDRDEPDRG